VRSQNHLRERVVELAKRRTLYWRVPPHACSKGNSEPSKGLPSAIMSTYAYGINDGASSGKYPDGAGNQLVSRSERPVDFLTTAQ